VYVVHLANEEILNLIITVMPRAGLASEHQFQSWISVSLLLKEIECYFHGIVGHGLSDLKAIIELNKYSLNNWMGNYASKQLPVGSHCVELWPLLECSLSQLS